MLDVSSRHVTHATAIRLAHSGLDDACPDIILSPWFDSGWIIRVPDAKEIQDVVSGLAAVLRYALKMKCDYVKLDQDGEVIAELETYTW